MLKFNILHLLTILFVVTSAKRKQQKGPSDIVASEEILEGILSKQQLFQDIFSERQIGDRLQFGHVYENPLEWEQRFEEKDFMNNRHRGKIQWGNVDGTHGEQYWDLNHK